MTSTAEATKNRILKAMTLHIITRIQKAISLRKRTGSPAYNKPGTLSKLHVFIQVNFKSLHSIKYVQL